MCSTSLSTPDFNLGENIASTSTLAPSVSVPEMKDIHASDVFDPDAVSFVDSKDISLPDYVRRWNPSNPSSFTISSTIVKSEFMELLGLVVTLRKSVKRLTEINSTLNSDFEAARKDYDRIHEQYYAEKKDRQHDRKEDRQAILALESDNRFLKVQIEYLRDENQRQKQQVAEQDARLVQSDNFFRALMDIKTCGPVLHKAVSAINEGGTAEEALVEAIMAAYLDENSIWRRVIIAAAGPRCSDVDAHTQPASPVWSSEITPSNSQISDVYHQLFDKPASLPLEPEEAQIDELATREMHSAESVTCSTVPEPVEEYNTPQKLESACSISVVRTCTIASPVRVASVSSPPRVVAGHVRAASVPCPTRVFPHRSVRPTSVPAVSRQAPSTATSSSSPPAISPRIVRIAPPKPTIASLSKVVAPIVQPRPTRVRFALVPTIVQTQAKAPSARSSNVRPALKSIDLNQPRELKKGSVEKKEVSRIEEDFLNPSAMALGKRHGIIVPVKLNIAPSEARLEVSLKESEESFKFPVAQEVEITIGEVEEVSVPCIDQLVSTCTSEISREVVLSPTSQVVARLAQSFSSSDLGSLEDSDNNTSGSDSDSDSDCSHLRRLRREYRREIKEESEELRRSLLFAVTGQGRDANTGDDRTPTAASTPAVGSSRVVVTPPRSSTVTCSGSKPTAVRCPSGPSRDVLTPSSSGSSYSKASSSGRTSTKASVSGLVRPSAGLVSRSVITKPSSGSPDRSHADGLETFLPDPSLLALRQKSASTTEVRPSLVPSRSPPKPAPTILTPGGSPKSSALSSNRGDPRATSLRSKTTPGQVSDGVSVPAVKLSGAPTSRRTSRTRTGVTTTITPPSPPSPATKRRSRIISTVPPSFYTPTVRSLAASKASSPLSQLITDITTESSRLSLPRNDLAGRASRLSPPSAIPARRLGPSTPRSTTALHINKRSIPPKKTEPQRVAQMPRPNPAPPSRTRRVSNSATPLIPNFRGKETMTPSQYRRLFGNSLSMVR